VAEIRAGGSSTGLWFCRRVRFPASEYVRQNFVSTREDFRGGKAWGRAFFSFPAGKEGKYCTSQATQSPGQAFTSPGVLPCRGT
jgi:hypothetical protein